MHNLDGLYVVADRLGLTGTKKPRSHRRIKKGIEERWQDFKRVEEMRKGPVLGRKMIDRLNRRYLVV